MFVIGIDPGLTRCGFGAVVSKRGRSEAVEFGVIRTPHTDELPARLSAVNLELRSLFSRLKPDVVVVERVFFQTNARTAMGVAQASGLALAAAHERGCQVFQYTSNEVKQAIAGFGGADKAQMQRMVQQILKLAELPTPADAADALALALHHVAVAPFSQLQQASRNVGIAQLESQGRASLGSATATGIGNAKIATSFGGVRLIGNVPADRSAAGAPIAAATKTRPGK